VDGQPIDRAGSLLRAYRDLLLDDLKRCGDVPRCSAATASADGWSVLVIACPAPAADGAAGLTQCDRDCLTLLAQSPEPVSGVRVRRELEKRGIGVWGEATVKRSLA
jgi:hypothetical protein